MAGRLAAQLCMPCLVLCVMSSTGFQKVLLAGLTAESSMSPEILGWHEQHDADNVQRTEGITALLLSGQSAEQTPGSHPASAFKGAQIPATKPMGKATRVQTPAARYSYRIAVQVVQMQS